MGKIGFTQTGWDDYIYWQTNNRKTIKKINDLLKDINRNGALEGLGKPEALKGDLSGYYSRRIDECNRLVYSILANGEIEVQQCKGHYDD